LGKFIGKITAFIIFASVNSIDCKNKIEHSLMHLGEKKKKDDASKDVYLKRENQSTSRITVLHVLLSF